MWVWQLHVQKGERKANGRFNTMATCRTPHGQADVRAGRMLPERRLGPPARQRCGIKQRSAHSPGTGFTHSEIKAA